MMLHSVCTTVVSYVVCIQVLAVDSGTLDLSADALQIPVGYVVPERGDVTFTCNSSLSVAPQWRVDFKSLGSTTVFSNSALLAAQLIINVSTTDEGDFPNPTSFTVHNIPTESNGSNVECSAPIENSDILSAIILVEGSPNCPNIQTRLTSESSLLVSVQQSHTTWLPVCYRVEVTSYNMSIQVAHNSTFSINESDSVNVTSLQYGSVYNISVTPCNSAGCNESCDIHSVQLVESATNPGGGGGDVYEDPLQNFLIIGLPILVAMTLLAMLALTIVLAILLIRFFRRRRARQKAGTEQGAESHGDKSTSNSEYAVISHSTQPVQGRSTQGPARQAGAVPPDYSTVQDAISNPRMRTNQTPPQPPVSSPPPQPCIPRDGTVHIDVQDMAGYASVAQSQGSKRIKTVPRIRQNTNQTPTNGADSPTNSSV